MLGLVASALSAISSAGVLPAMAKCSLFWTILKNSWVSSALGVVVHRQFVDVSDFLVKPFFAGPDVPNPFQQFVEIVGPDVAHRLEPFIVHGEALDQVFIKALGGPTAELGASERPDAISPAMMAGRL